ncbi:MULTISPECIES: bifunctional DNA primase/polymerase [Streptomyces]|uniref:Bifunctional DNA primase/polymerase n=1 Tax=Streptomyces sudanensis TaxID=436397 RepID=A0ABY4THF4_9ACTN|nr:MULTISPECIES: bifunctional DNA primase/polymerase [Streptomyces]MCP9986285.1 bifunctional DNA primase/polymerase [Streptomyces sudanensis]URN17758.1 bifunctional DNA primase/polymerase [Streptomyces sudanensis]
MGFTIGGTRIRELRSRRTGLTGLAGLALPGSRRRTTRVTECALVAGYTGLWGWDVVPGARIASGRCSCGDRSCGAPGAHPLGCAPEVPAGAPREQAAETWSRFPGAPLLLPTGRSFDVLEVAETAGRRALVRLERMGLPLGPVCVTPTRRAQFFVAPGAARELPGLLYRLGWDDADLDLRCLGPGSWITAPPSDLGGLGPVHWLRPPSPDAGRTMPQARLLIGTLAYISHRSAAA